MRIQVAFSITLMLFCSPLVAFAQLPPEAPSGEGDQLLIAADLQLFEAPLPRGPAVPSMPLTETIDDLAQAPDGRLMAFQRPIFGSSRARLLEISDHGMVTIGELDLSNDEPFGLAFSSTGRLYLLTELVKSLDPPRAIKRLLEIDPETAAILGAVELGEDISSLAMAPDGLWALSFEGLYRLDPTNGALWFTGIQSTGPATTPISADIDSSGALWILTITTVTSPPILELVRLDPVTGSRQSAPFEIPRASALAVRRNCRETSTTRCLQGGRFRVEVAWEDFENRTGLGQAAASGSIDSALFWFFDPANWEILIKVLDGCGTNDYFWVFAAASTNVGYSVRVTDLETGRTQLIENSRGQTMPATTDTRAFHCSP